MLTYEELFAEYTKVLAENKRLTAENQTLRKQLVMPERHNSRRISVDSGNSTTDKNSINKRSAPAEKIRLFMSLFSGRTDVFARRWHSITTEKSGYQPVCGNEWNVMLCNKRKYKCSDCPNRKLLPLTEKDIYNHLAGKDAYGRDVVGIYPMLKYETCNFLCVDFDEENFKQDVAAFREVCIELNVSACVELSRSGNGAHVWIFFSEPISALLARKLGTGILTRAMESRTNLSFKSYDRLFPNQDTMPNGGFGNLIALPLQGLARKQGNSLFVDEYFVPYPDQWEYLSNVRKTPLDQVENLVSAICKNGEFGSLVSDSDSRPWESKTVTAVTAFDFPKNMTIIRANMLFVPMQGLSSSAKNQIKRLAAFKNPDFYRAQAMRLPIYNKPRIICTADIFDDYIALPRGCEDALCSLLDCVSVVYSIDDKTNSGAEISASFNGELRDEQQPAANALLENTIGVLSATTAFGKTVIASYLISQRKRNTLILVHTQSLMQQWQKSLEQFLSIGIIPPETKGRGRKRKWSPIGLLGGGKNSLGGTVDIAVMQSLVNGDEVKSLVRNYGMIIVDECHHVSAVNFEKILNFANAKYVYGLTATPTRQDGHHPIIFMQCGQIRYKVDAKSQAEKRKFEHYLITKFTSYRCSDKDMSIAKLYKYLAENEMRNSQIVKDVVDSIKSKRTPIVLTERREHMYRLAEMLKKYCKNVITLCGVASQKERRQTLEQLQSVPDNEPMIVVATGKYVGEGFDFPRLDTLFLALPISWKGKVAQYAGRLHRNYPGKSEVQIYDYVDLHVPVLEKMYQKRLKSYAEIGYKIKSDSSLADEADIIYDGKNYYGRFANDLKSANKEILIVSPFMNKNRLVQITKILSEATLNGVSTTVITRPPEDFDEKKRENITKNTALLNSYGVKVKYKSDFCQKFSVIDKQIVWYGSVNFLSFGTGEENVMRLCSFDVAGRLMEEG